MTMPIRNRAKFTAAELLADVKQHAETYQNNGRGWDMLVGGAFEDTDLFDIIGKATSFYGARNRVYRELQALKKLDAEQGAQAA